MHFIRLPLFDFISYLFFVRRFDTIIMKKRKIAKICLNKGEMVRLSRAILYPT